MQSALIRSNFKVLGKTAKAVWKEITIPSYVSVCLTIKDAMKQEIFGQIDGKNVIRYTLTNGRIIAKILNFGGTVQSLLVPDKNGNYIDVVLGYDDIESYRKNSGYLGAVIGRVCNRTEKGRFILNGKEYNVGINNGENSLHGGVSGFDDKIWDAEVVGETLKLQYVSPDGEEGYPAMLKTTVVYSIEDDGLKIDYSAVADGDTVVSLTNHTYFNLDGEGNGDILGTTLFIDADSVTPVNDKLIPNGEFMSVEKTPHDFRVPKTIGRDIDSESTQLSVAGGYDTNFVLNGSGFRKIASAKAVNSGIRMDVYTDRVGVQFYSGNFLSDVTGKGGNKYKKRYGFCLETQGFPNAINCPSYPSPVLKKGELYHTVTKYSFKTE